MNHTSISAADTGTSGILLKSGVSDTKESTDSAESGGFLSALGAIFSSEGESTESTETSEAKVSKAELSAQAVEKLVEAEGDETVEADEEKIIKEGEKSSGSEVLLTGTDDETTQESASKSTKPEESKVAKAMSEGNELLVRLDESSQALSKADGKQLPHSDKTELEDTEQAEKLAALKPFMEKSEADLDRINASKNADSSLVAEAEKAHSETSRPEGQTLHISTHQASEADQLRAISGTDSDNEGKSVTENQDSTEAIRLSSVSGLKEQVAADAEQLANTELKPVTGQMSETGTDKQTSLVAQGEVINPEKLVWKSEQPIHPGQVVLPPDFNPQNVKTPDTASLEAMMRQLNLDDVPLEELSAEELEYLVQISNAGAHVNATTVSAELMKVMPEPVLPKSSVNPTQNQLTQSFAQPTASLQGDRIPLAMASQQAPAELNFAQISQAQSFNPAQVAIVSNAGNQQQMMKAAAALSGATTVSVSGDKGESKEAALSQQLAGLAASQGTQQSQARAEVQQAIAQSPLQLSREAAGERLSEQVQMMMSKNLKNIDIRLDPPELGRMQIRMTMHSDGASVQFTVANQQARDMIEQAMPRLREMLAQQGLQLSDSSVHQQGSGQRQNQYADANENAGSGSQNRQGGEPNLDESINLDVNIQTKDDGISYYA